MRIIQLKVKKWHNLLWSKLCLTKKARIKSNRFLFQRMKIPSSPHSCMQTRAWHLSIKTTQRANTNRTGSRMKRASNDTFKVWKLASRCGSKVTHRYTKCDRLTILLKLCQSITSNQKLARGLLRQLLTTWPRTQWSSSKRFKSSRWDTVCYRSFSTSTSWLLRREPNQRTKRSISTHKISLS